MSPPWEDHILGGKPPPDGVAFPVSATGGGAGTLAALLSGVWTERVST